MITFDSKDNSLKLDLYGNLCLLNKVDALSEKIKQRLSLKYGEWFLNNKIGVNYIDNIFGDTYNIDVARHIIREEILKEENVLSISNIYIDVKDRLLSYKISIETIYGDIEIEK